MTIKQAHSNLAMLLLHHNHVALYPAERPLPKVEELGIGEQLFEGKGKTQIMTIKKVDAEGVTVEFTWAGDVKGSGKAQGVNGSIVFTGTKIAALSNRGAGATIGQGILFTSKDMVAIESSGYGNPRWENQKSVEIWHFRTVSETLSWLNKVVAIVTQEGDPAWKEFSISIKEFQ